MAEPTQWQAPEPPPTAGDGTDDADPARRFWDLWRRGRRPGAEDFLARAGISDPAEIVPVLRVDQAERCGLGQWVPAEAYLDAFPVVRASAECAIDLVFGEYLLRDERGERPRLEDFQGRFPQYAGELKLQVELHIAMRATPAPAASRSASPATLAIEEGPGPGPAVYPVIPGYEILGELGRGGMGLVYRAWQDELKRPVAVKMVHAGARAGPQVLARFRVEAEAVARLRHPNIVQIHDVGHHAGAPFLVLELVEGGSLAQRLAGTPQPADWAAATMETMARAIHAAHLEGVVHRDLSPSNILLDAAGVPKITDFGLAKLLVGGGSPHTQTGDLLGTPSYMAPEQAGGHRGEIGPATDVYALGAILYEMLTGRPPFKAERPLETLRQVLGDEPVPPSRLRPGLSRDLETICLRCLRKEPARRYADAEAMADDLRRFREGRPILARRSTSTEHFWRWCRRNPWLAGANIAAAILTTIVAIGSTAAAWTLRDQLTTIRFSESLERRARTEASQQLFGALLDRARAGRYSRRVGQRFDSLDALERATRIGRELKLPPDRFDAIRDEVIACLALPDLKATGRVIHTPAGAVGMTFDPALTRYALRFDDRVEVRRAADDEEVARFEARGDREVADFFSPDGRYLASTHYPSSALTVWDVERRVLIVNDPGPVVPAGFFPESRRIVVGHPDGELLVHDLGTGRVIHRWRGPAPARSLAIRPDGTRIALMQDEGAGPACRIVEADTGRLIRSIPLTSSDQVAWSPDGTTLATTAPDLKISLWEADTGSRRAILEGSTSGGLAATFHPAGTLLASNGWEGRLRLWDVALGRPVLSMTGWSVPQFGPDGRIAIGLSDGWTPYRVEPALEYRTLAQVSPRPMDYHRLSIRGDGRMLAVGTGRGAVLWDLAHAKELAVLPIGDIPHLMFEASGDLLTSGSIGVWRWPVRLDPARGEFRIGPPRRLPLPGGPCWIDEDRSGRIVAKAANDSVSVLTPGRTFRVGNLDDCRYVAVSPDGEWLATGSHARGGVQVRRVGDPARVTDILPDGAARVHFSPDGRWLMTSGSACRLWAVGTWREARQIGWGGHDFSPDGRLAVVVDPSQVIRLVEVESGRTVARLESPDSSPVDWATFTPDGSRLVMSTNDGPAVHVWDLRAIRRHLVGMGLDWIAPAYPDDDPAGPAAPPLPPPRLDFGPLARELESLNEAPEALIQRSTARLATHPDDAEAHHHRGHALGQLRRFDEAIDDFTAAIRLRPDDAHFRSARGRISGHLGRYEPAIADLESALERRTDDPTVPESLAMYCNNRAWELATGPGPRRHLGHALALSRRALVVARGENEYILNTLGVVQYRACLYAEAVATLEESLALGRGRSDGFDLVFLAMAHHRLGHGDVARDCLDRAVRWQGAQKRLSAAHARELSAFRAEAEAVLAGPSGELPADVFATPR